MHHPTRYVDAAAVQYATLTSHWQIKDLVQTSGEEHEYGSSESREQFKIVKYHEARKTGHYFNARGKLFLCYRHACSFVCSFWRCFYCFVVFNMYGRLSPLILNVIISLLESMQKCRLLVLLFIFIVSFNLILLFC